MILEKYDIKVSLPAVGRLLKKNGIRRLKSGSLPAKADAAKQRAFFDTVLQPLMARVIYREHLKKALRLNCRRGV
jgi:hypothetical protein